MSGVLKADDLTRILAAHLPHVFSEETPIYLTEESPDQPGPHWQTLGDKLKNWAKGYPVPNPFPPSTFHGPVIY